MPAEGSAGALNIAYWNYGPAAETGNQAIADGFMAENPGVTVTLTPIAGENWGTYYANLATAHRQRRDARHGVHRVGGHQVPARQNGLVVPINDYLANDPDAAALQGEHRPALLQSFAFGDDITALPQGWNNMIVYYNKGVFDEAGVPYPSADWTWDEFRETAQKLTADTDGDGNNDRTASRGPATRSSRASCRGSPTRAATSSTTTSRAPTANSPEVVKAVTFLKGLLDDGIAATPSPMGDIFTGFQNGSIAMFGAGRWPSATFLGNGFDDWDIQYYPVGDTRETVAGAAGYAIMTSAADPDLAWAFQKYTVSERRPGRAHRHRPMRRVTPSRPSARPPQKTVEAGIPPANGAIFYGSVDDYPTLTPFPAPAKYSEYESTVLRNLQLIFAGEVPVQEGLDTLQQELTSDHPGLTSHPSD